MLLEGERDAQLLKICDDKVTNLESKITTLEAREKITNIQLKLVNNQAESLIKLNTSLQRKADRRKTFGIVTTALTVVLGTLLVLK